METTPEFFFASSPLSCFDDSSGKRVSAGLSSLKRKDPTGKNVFEGGFLGLDNIGVFDRSASLPTGGKLEQADGTAWMVVFSQQMLRIALELAEHDPLYEDFAMKFFEHTIYIASSMDRSGDQRMSSGTKTMDSSTTYSVFLTGIPCDSK